MGKSARGGWRAISCGTRLTPGLDSSPACADYCHGWLLSALFLLAHGEPLIELRGVNGKLTTAAARTCSFPGPFTLSLASTRWLLSFVHNTVTAYDRFPLLLVVCQDCVPAGADHGRLYLLHSRLLSPILARIGLRKIAAINRPSSTRSRFTPDISMGVIYTLNQEIPRVYNLSTGPFCRCSGHESGPLLHRCCKSCLRTKPRDLHGEWQEASSPGRRAADAVEGATDRRSRPDFYRKSTALGCSLRCRYRGRHRAQLIRARRLAFGKPSRRQNKVMPCP